MKLQHPTPPGGNRLAARLGLRTLAPLVLALATGCAGGEGDANPPAEDASTESLTRSLVTTPPETLPGEQIDFPGLGYDFGDPEAPLRIAELSDFGCGFCRQFHQQGYAAELGLNSEQFESCIAEERPGRRIADGGRAARALGMRGTPSFLINGFPVQGALPIQLFRDILDNELEALAEAAGSGG